MKVFHKTLARYKALPFTKKIIVSVIVTTILFINFYMIANCVNHDDGAFELSNTGVVWIFYLLVMGFYFFYFEVRDEKSGMKYLKVVSYEKNTEILVLANNEGQQYRFNLELLKILVQNGFLKKDGDNTFQIIQLDNIVLFTTILNRINALDRKLHKESSQQETLSKVSDDIQWIKEKLGYEFTPVDL